MTRRVITMLLPENADPDVVRAACDSMPSGTLFATDDLDDVVLLNEGQMANQGKVWARAVHAGYLRECEASAINKNGAGG